MALRQDAGNQMTETLNARALDLKAVSRQFNEHGYCVIRGVLSAEELDAARVALERVRLEDEARGTALRYGPGLSNQRIWVLLNRAEAFVNLAMHPVMLAVIRELLGYDEVLLSTMSANITGPGGDHGIGRLHADQSFLPGTFPQRLMVNTAFLLDDYTEENGATVFIPGSHRSPEGPPEEMPPPSKLAQITGRAGDLALWDGFLHHATGLNRTADQQRRGVIATYFPPFLRTQENWCRTLDRELLDKYPGLAALTGFAEWRTMGGVNGGAERGLNF
jgi:ectoine hydroxylase-related dioxygenase (phytanoyl-CoA dioxygenase family)